MLLTEKDTSIQKHLTEMLTVKCGTAIEFEMKYEIAEKS